MFMLRLQSRQLQRSVALSNRQLFSTRTVLFNSNKPKNSDELVPSEPSSTAPLVGPDAKGYVPRLSYERVSYEYPPPPKKPKFVPAESKPWKRHIPALAAVLGIAWAMYAYKYFLSGEKTSNEKLLEPDRFTPFKITYKEDITEDLQLIELSPNYEQFRTMLKSKDNSLWNGKKLWSVEVKQPEIQVVRRYTPLPMYYMQGLDGKSLLRLLGGKEEDEGRMVLLVKKYNDGEVSRWLHRMPVGSIVELRGPFVGHRFPYSPIDKAAPMRQTMEDLPSRMSVEPEGLPEALNVPEPENIVFFAGGTGIAPILQSLFSKNPPRGHVDVHYSVANRNEIPFKRFLLFLEKTGRAKFYYHIDNENSFLTAKDIPAPGSMQYLGYRNEKLSKELEKEKKLAQMMEQIRKERSGEAAQSSTTQEAKHEIIDFEATKQAEAASEAKISAPESATTKTPVKYRSVLEQAAAWAKQPQRPASLAIVCGPPGYVDYVSGKRDLSGRGPVAGLLGQKGWDTTNVHRME
jgi:ferredoxin-NADP reductase